MNLDLTVHLADLLVIIGAAYAVLRKLNRIEDALSDFPPHRHVNGRILFPKGYSPGRMGHLNSD